jgi:hypothetical protein
LFLSLNTPEQTACEECDVCFDAWQACLFNSYS